MPTFSLIMGQDSDLRGSETVLLVEDNKQVRHLAKSVLIRHGYQVLEAEHGAQALSILADQPQEIHLLLTDVIMPEMNGKEHFEQACAYAPDLKVIYMSGYTDNVIAHQGVLDPGIAFIQKPFTIQDLTEKVREVLD